MIYKFVAIAILLMFYTFYIGKMIIQRKKGIQTDQIRILGAFIGVLGVLLFALAVWTMRDSWRAGIPESDKTEIVTFGIYSYNRNPAFLGFYLMYIGILLMFFHLILLLFSIFAIIMLHIQVLQEEMYLSDVFGEQYLDYKSKVHRYIGSTNKTA